MLSLNVGGEEDQNDMPLAAVDQWASQLETVVPEMIRPTQTLPPVNLEQLSKVWFLELRDQAQAQLDKSLHQYPLASSSLSPATGSLELALAPEQFQSLQKSFQCEPMNLEKYYEIQNDLTEKMKATTELQQQWLGLPQHSSELPQMRNLLEKLFQTYREAHQQWLQLTRESTEKLWQLRVDLVEAYVMLIRDAIQSFNQEAQKVYLIYQQVEGELKRQIQEAENNEFYHDFRRLQNNVRFWLQSIRTLLPAALQFQQHVLETETPLSTESDPCCLRRVQELQDQLQRVRATLTLQQDTPQQDALQQQSLTRELEMASTEWSQTQSQLNQVEQALQDLSRQRVLLWSRDQAVSELETLERKQLTLEEKHETLLRQIAPLRATLEKLRQETSQRTQHTQADAALQQCDDWILQLQRFQEKCQQESQWWSEGRGLQYRAKMTVQEETARTLQSLLVTAQQKVDGSGLALLRYGLMLWQNLWASAAVQHQAVMSKQTTAQQSLEHYIQRLTLGHPALAELLHQHWQLEKRLTELRNELEEMQLSHAVRCRMQKALAVRI